MSESATPSQAGLLGPATLMIGARLVSMVMGIVTIPFLIHYLGSTGFAAWALLLALAAGFALLDLGAQHAVVRYVAVPADSGDWRQARSTLGSLWIQLALSFGIGLMAIFWAAGPLAAWLRLPGTLLLAPHIAYTSQFQKTCAA